MDWPATIHMFDPTSDALSEHDNPLGTSAPAILSRLADALQNLLHHAGVDRAVIFAVLTPAWQIATGPITLLLIARYLTPEQQGFFYTFISLLALRTFVELGFYIVIINVASHEWTHLKIDDTGHVVGEPAALSRLVSLGRLIFKWYAVASAIFVFVVGSAGYYFFSQQPYPGIAWQAPWLILVILTGFLLWMLPFNSLLEGCNQVVPINRFRLEQTVLGSLAMWITLVLDGGLWALVIYTGVSLLRNLYLLLIQYRPFFAPFIQGPSGPRMRWRTEIWPMQWRLALSGLVNYFAFSLFNPIMFRYHGAVVAGQMGMTWQVATALQTAGMAWVSTRVPRFGMLISQRDYATLDRFWLRLLVVSLVAICGGAGMIWLVVYGLNTLHISLAQRLLSPWPTSLL
jgi:hypothetical protein